MILGYPPFQDTSIRPKKDTWEPGTSWTVSCRQGTNSKDSAELLLAIAKLQAPFAAATAMGLWLTYRMGDTGRMVPRGSPYRDRSCQKIRGLIPPAAKAPAARGSGKKGRVGPLLRGAARKHHGFFSLGDQIYNCLDLT